jgi:hypothetical protein
MTSRGLPRAEELCFEVRLGYPDSGEGRIEVEAAARDIRDYIRKRAEIIQVAARTSEARVQQFTDDMKGGDWID